ncbi:diguanylate cyclase [Pseudobacteroides cellulosolvens]|uniref:Diguanylate cyclase n=1 Tax=Pseudobacteroides cellulosolvens ATCC 35603 = DSM 2933 TaxID=398512 RepID=A0A0L6JJW7_9FIRM|nr:GGDEF domain-containing protein [Pseudobacteroides cellulosolvens]KNY26176.1 diguanylate cyclase [Pseudobacteroides cellulosolvens ATCC 35603 = DSM 2933]
MKGKRLTFGFVMDTIISWADFGYYQSMILSGITEFTEENDINLICFVVGKLHPYEDWENSRNIIYEYIDEDKVDGLILLSSALETFSADIIGKLVKVKNIPIVTIGQSFENYYSVSVDNSTGMKQVVDHLLEEHGCKRLAFIKGPEDSLESQVRFDAFCDSLKSHNIPVYDELICKGNFLITSGVEAIRSLIEKNIEFDAIVAANDIMAVGAIEELNKHIRSSLHEVPVTGFDNVDINRGNILTTVNQPCYDLGKNAAVILQKAINGEKVEKNVMLPSEMVLRSSCRCIPGVVRNTLLAKEYIEDECNNIEFNQFKTIVISYMKAINESIELFDSSFLDELLEYEEDVIGAFFAEIDNGQKNEFLHKWNNLLLFCTNNRINIFFLHDIISILRKFIIEYIDKKKYGVMLENLFQAAHILVSEGIRRGGSSFSILSQDQFSDLIMLDESLISNMDTHEQMNLIEKHIYNYDINRCYISLYEDSQKPMDYSILIHASRKDKKFDTKENGIRYETKKMLPDEFIEELCSKKFNIVVQSLHFGQYQIGTCILGFDKMVNRAFEIIRNRLSIALNSALMVERIKNQSNELEKLVVERTKELSIINDQLKAEIDRRSDAEFKLRKILEELEQYNNQLHNQSIRDELTGLYNRRGFMKLGYEQYNKLKNSKSGFLLFYADLDGLKQINDKYGHSAGDEAIKGFAGILNKSFRDLDIISRFGGDEFIIIAIGACPDDVNAILERIQNNSDQYNKNNNLPYIISGSVGSAYYDPQINTEFETLIKLADEALYKAKQYKKSLVK